ncbi:MAG TPA: hypothetical protein HPP83_07480 [Candidatus Hydrogenedentes bacterium]|nr:hypothetical protein [Candidatus Hydrogenedentota bacterium]
MHPLVLEFANGRTFFYGMVISLIACASRLRSKGGKSRGALRIVAILGAVLVIASATPLPIWIYVLWLLLLAVNAALPARDEERAKKRGWLVFGCLAVLAILMMMLEAPYHLTPSIPFPRGKALYVIGDSLSMGADTQEQNWPELLGVKANVPVRNFSFGGAKVGSALHNAERIEADDALVILEIGGNDVLYRTAVRDYAADLGELLATVCQPGRQVVMFELPLPPFHNGYGRVQRKLARTYGVTLIPKRYLTKVLGAPDSTLDGLHFSHTGNELMAETVWRLFEKRG